MHPTTISIATRSLALNKKLRSLDEIRITLQIFTVTSCLLSYRHHLQLIIRMLRIVTPESHLVTNSRECLITRIDIFDTCVHIYRALARFLAAFSIV
jgi:hypothetical protein